MLYCNLQVFFCTEIAVEKHFEPRNVTSGGASAGGLKKFSTLAIARHILGPPHKLCCNSTTAHLTAYINMYCTTIVFYFVLRIMFILF